MSERKKTSHADPITETPAPAPAPAANGQQPPEQLRYLACQHNTLARVRAGSPIMTCGAGCGVIYVITGNAVFMVPPNTTDQFIQDLLVAKFGSEKKAEQFLDQVTGGQRAVSQLYIPGRS